MRKKAAASGFLALLLGCSLAAPLHAASSAWASGEGARLRLVTAGPADADGTLRGVLEIALEPGWKTYWRDPGANGVPPSLDISASTGWTEAALLFPAPERHDDGYGAWAGYAAPVALPVLLRAVDGNAGTIEADVFLGVCRDICVPMAAKLVLDPAGGDGPQDGLVVARAFRALPGQADAGFGIAGKALAGDRLLLDARVPAGESEAPELFLAGGNGFGFGLPKAERAEAGWRFAVPVLAAPKAGGPVFYTLKSGGEAVSGTVTLP